ncbi:MAG: hypothetical protein WDA22_08915 [Bacteroidota bacterium]
MKRSTSILILLSICGSLLTAQQLSSIPASFVDIGFGARPAALGGAFTALANDANSTLWNPAGMASARNSQSSFSTTKQLGLLTYNSFSTIIPLTRSRQAFGLAVISSGDKSLQEITVQMSYARSFGEKLRIGVSGKYRNASFGNNAFNSDTYILFEQDEISEGQMNQIQGSASGFGVDVGLQYSLSSKIQFGVMAKDVYAPLQWNSVSHNTTKKAKGKYDEPIPTELSIGTSLKMFENVVVTSDYHPALSGSGTNALNSGMEIVLLQMISLRGGIRQPFNNDADAKYTAGLGINYSFGKNFCVLLDYSMIREFLADTQTLSVGMEF